MPSLVQMAQGGVILKLVKLPRGIFTMLVNRSTLVLSVKKIDTDSHSNDIFFSLPRLDGLGIALIRLASLRILTWKATVDIGISSSRASSSNEYDFSTINLKIFRLVRLDKESPSFSRRSSSSSVRRSLLIIVIFNLILAECDYK